MLVQARNPRFSRIAGLGSAGQRMEIHLETEMRCGLELQQFRRSPGLILALQGTRTASVLSGNTLNLGIRVLFRPLPVLWTPSWTPLEVPMVHDTRVGPVSGTLGPFPPLQEP